MIERFRKFGLTTVLVAGFIDGLNPCAFATIVFLVSYLSFLGKKSKEILTYGLIFTFGVFIAYLVAGMGLMAGFRQLSGFPLITKGIYLVIAVFAFVLGIISFYDYILYRRGQGAKMKLQLPMALILKRAEGSSSREEFIQPLSKKYPLEIQSFPLNKLENYDLLGKFEKEWNQKDNELPVVIIGNYILGGATKIQKDLEGLVKSYAGGGGVSWPSLQVTKTERWITQAPTEEEKKSQKIIYGAFLYRRGCLDCEGKKSELKQWVSKVPDLRIGAFDTMEDETKSLMRLFIKSIRFRSPNGGSC